MTGTGTADRQTAMSFGPIPWLVPDEHLDRAAAAADPVVFVTGPSPVLTGFTAV